MSRFKMSYQAKAITILSITIAAILLPMTCLIYQLSEDILLTVTLAIFLSYILTLCAYRLFYIHFSPVTQLQAYIDAKKQGQSNLSLGYNDATSPWAALSTQIETLFTEQSSPSERLIDDRDLGEIGRQQWRLLNLDWWLR